MAMASPPAIRRSARTSAAVALGRLANRTSRWLGRGTGAVIGGRVAIKLDPQVLPRLTAGRPVTIVSGTNGKTTTTRLVAEALGSQRSVSTTRGANMPPGLVVPASVEADELVFEVDELWVPQVVEQTRASVLVLLNISRDQLDRITEIRRIAEVWRTTLARADWPLTVVANADDPLVVWAASGVRARTPTKPTNSVCSLRPARRLTRNICNCSAPGSLWRLPMQPDGARRRSSFFNGIRARPRSWISSRFNERGETPA